MSNFFTLLLAREARLLCRRPAELANPLVFFAIGIAAGIGSAGVAKERFISA